MRIQFRAAAWMAGMMVFAFGMARAQGPSGKCTIDLTASQAGRDTRAFITRLPTGNSNFFVGGGFINKCREQDVTLRSDSAEYYGDNKLLYLIGNVHYTEPRATIDARNMTYWTDEGHVRAEGDVYAVLHNGSTMRGPVADYYRIVPGVRSQTMLVATGRPRLGIVQRDSITGKISDTVHVIAERVTTIADSLTYAGGDVHITRPEMLATGDSAFMDSGTGRAKLLGHPTVEARRARPFTLTGGVIDVFSTNKQADRVVAAPNGHATSQDLQLYADTVDLRIHTNVLQRAMAWGKTRARATSPDQDLVADSIDAILPNQQVQEIRAVRSAMATAVPDTATIISSERDWMRGDTIVAYFDTLPRRDTSHTPPIKNLIASTQARAYYHVATRDAKSNPGVNYVRGRVINVAFDQRAVKTVTVQDRASGVYLEAITDTTAAKNPKKPAAKTPRTQTPARTRPRIR